MFAGTMAEYWIAKILFQRGLALIYLFAFIVALRQFKGLCGEKGILPMTDFVEKASFKNSPSLFHFTPSDRAAQIAAVSGIILSLLALTGVSESFGLLFSMTVWTLLYLLYLSFVNVGQTFYSFGWESMLLEAGFFAIFLGPLKMAAPVAVIFLIRCIGFRNMFGAGLIKIRGDQCWKDLTCMDWHYETQPLPNPLSWFFDKLPKPLNKFSVAYNHFAELILPFFYFMPQPYASIAGVLTIIFHIWLLISGNYAFLTALSIVLAIPLISDKYLQFIPVDQPAIQPTPLGFEITVFVVTVITLFLSYYPVKNMISPSQKMNTGFNPLKIVNTYGAFGSVTKKRYEVVLEATEDENLEDADWMEYKHLGKPVELSRIPPQIAPYHSRLDWQMWFLPLSRYQRRWFRSMLKKLLEGNKDVQKLFSEVPSDEPEYIRAKMYRYEFTSWSEWRETGNWWKRTEVDDYYPPVSKNDF
jgi:hypothetical protein